MIRIEVSVLFNQTCIKEKILPICIFVVTLLKSVLNRLVSDVLGVLTSFGFSNIILALPSEPTETIVPAGDPAVKSSRKTAQRTPEKSQNTTANEL